MIARFDIPVVVKKDSTRKRHAEIVMSYLKLKKSGVRPGAAIDAVGLSYGLTFQYVYRIILRSRRL